MQEICVLRTSLRRLVLRISDPEARRTEMMNVLHMVRCSILFIHFQRLNMLLRADPNAIILSARMSGTSAISCTLLEVIAKDECRIGKCPKRLGDNGVKACLIRYSKSPNS